MPLTILLNRPCAQWNGPTHQLVLMILIQPYFVHSQFSLSRQIFEDRFNEAIICANNGSKRPQTLVKPDGESIEIVTYSKLYLVRNVGYLRNSIQLHSSTAPSENLLIIPRTKLTAEPLDRKNNETPEVQTTNPRQKALYRDFVRRRKCHPNSRRKLSPENLRRSRKKLHFQGPLPSDLNSQLTLTLQPETPDGIIPRISPSPTAPSSCPASSSRTRHPLQRTRNPLQFADCTPRKPNREAQHPPSRERVALRSSTRAIPAHGARRRRRRRSKARRRSNCKGRAVFERSSPSDGQSCGS